MDTLNRTPSDEEIVEAARKLEDQLGGTVARRSTLIQLVRQFCKPQDNTELDLLRIVYENARSFLRFNGVDRERVTLAVDALDRTVEDVKQFDGGTHEAPEQDYEHWQAIKEGECVAATDEYFAARPIQDGHDGRKLFEDGFDRGYRAAEKREAVTPFGLSPEQEPKYTTDGYSIINRASGEAIPSDEPIFIFRARDKHACSMLGEYAEFCSDPEHAGAVIDRFIQFGEWAEAHPERMKEPDTEPSPAPAESTTPTAGPTRQYWYFMMGGSRWYDEGTGPFRKDAHERAGLGWRVKPDADPIDIIREKAQALIEEAERMGVSLLITREHMKPLAMGNARHVVDVWAARHGAKP